MKKSYLIIFAVIILLGGYFLLSSGSSDVTQVNDSPEMLEENAADSDASADEATSDQVFTLDSFNFGYSETEIRVKQGEVVTVNLTNSEGFHDWVVDEFAAATEKIKEGDTTSVTFVADQAGTFEYYCSVGSHRANGMVGTLIVE